MCIGVRIESAGKKFTGSLNRWGCCIEMVRNTIRTTSTLTVSFLVKNGWNDTLSMFLFNPIGFLDPFVCRHIKWMITMNAMRNGKMKWSEKNRFRVGFSIEYPPHNHSTIIFPAYGTAVTRLVITVAPQNDI